jgi:hypothetical protein
MNDYRAKEPGDYISPELQELAERMIVDEIRNNPAAITLTRNTPEWSVPVTGTSYPLYATQEALDHLAENITSMLDEAMHLEACWISEDETRCVCIISQLRAVLPQCGHVESVGVKGRTRQCLSTVHPSAPYKHVFGTV